MENPCIGKTTTSVECSGTVFKRQQAAAASQFWLNTKETDGKPTAIVWKSNSDSENWNWSKLFCLFKVKTRHPKKYTRRRCSTALCKIYFERSVIWVRHRPNVNLPKLFILTHTIESPFKKGGGQRKMSYSWSLLSSAHVPSQSISDVQIWKIHSVHL